MLFARARRLVWCPASCFFFLNRYVGVKGVVCWWEMSTGYVAVSMCFESTSRRIISRRRRCRVCIMTCATPPLSFLSWLRRSFLPRKGNRQCRYYFCCLAAVVSGLGYAIFSIVKCVPYS